MKVIAKVMLASCVLALSSFAVAGGDAEAGKAKSAACAGCHGADGNSAVPMYPHLAGQYADYLEHAMQAYKSGERQNAIMQGMVGGLTDDDIENLAAYYAGMSGKLADSSLNP